MFAAATKVYVVTDNYVSCESHYLTTMLWYEGSEFSYVFIVEKCRAAV